MKTGSSPLRYINPIFLINKVFRILRELNNFVYYKRTARELNRTNQLQSRNLKIDWVGRLYTAINIQPELLLYYKDTELIKHEKLYVGNEISKLNDFFFNMGLLELVKVKFKRIYDSSHYAYLIYTKFAWKEITFGWLMWYSIIGFLGYKGVMFILESMNFATSLGF